MDWLAEVPAVLQLWYPGQEGGRALADVLFGDADPGGRLPLSFPRRIEDHGAYLHYPGENGQVHYGEGIFVGYRFYDHVDREPLFPFGHGLSYAPVDVANPRLARRAITVGETAQLTVDVTNPGPRDGQAVVQVYVSEDAPRLARPPRELAAFAKVPVAAGETREVTLDVPPRAFAVYDPAGPGWATEPGSFTLHVGLSSRDLRETVELTLEA